MSDEFIPKSVSDSTPEELERASGIICMRVDEKDDRPLPATVTVEPCATCSAEIYVSASTPKHMKKICTRCGLREADLGLARLAFMRKPPRSEMH